MCLFSLLGGKIKHHLENQDPWPLPEALPPVPLTWKRTSRGGGKFPQKSRAFSTSKMGQDMGLFQLKSIIFILECHDDWKTTFLLFGDVANLMRDYHRKFIIRSSRFIRFILVAGFQASGLSWNFIPPNLDELHNPNTIEIWNREVLTMKLAGFLEIFCMKSWKSQYLLHVLIVFDNNPTLLPTLVTVVSRFAKATSARGHLVEGDWSPSTWTCCRFGVCVSVPLNLAQMLIHI